MKTKEQIRLFNIASILMNACNQLERAIVKLRKGIDMINEDCKIKTMIINLKK